MKKIKLIEKWKTATQPAPFIRIGKNILHIDNIKHIDTSDLENGKIKITTFDDREYFSQGIEALDAIMHVKPSALEGRRLKWQRNEWAWHNMVIHPMVQILAFAGLKEQAVKLHDSTIPRPKGFKRPR